MKIVVCALALTDLPCWSMGWAHLLTLLSRRYVSGLLFCSSCPRQLSAVSGSLSNIKALQNVRVSLLLFPFVATLSCISPDVVRGLIVFNWFVFVVMGDCSRFCCCCFFFFLGFYFFFCFLFLFVFCCCVFVFFLCLFFRFFPLVIVVVLLYC